MMNEHKYNSGQKLRAWGYGEWVEEPEAVVFFRHGFQCRVIRCPPGFLSGAVAVSYFLPIYHRPDIMEKLVVHGRNASVWHQEDKYVVGFVCDQGDDYIPETREGSIYRSVNYCIDTLIPLAQELYHLNQIAACSEKYRLD